MLRVALGESSPTSDCGGYVFALLLRSSARGDAGRFLELVTATSGVEFSGALMSSGLCTVGVFARVLSNSVNSAAFVGFAKISTVGRGASPGRLMG